ncbi:MAG: response regulator transcription factor, partial [Pyrinomonadaceae bacterium]
MTLVLGRSGFEVVCIGEGDEAIALAKAKAFDLYLLDTWTPGTDGLSLCAKLRQFDTSTPILFYSGAGYESDLKRAFDSGAQGYLVKPV